MGHQMKVKELLNKEIQKSKCPGCPHNIGLTSYSRTALIRIFLDHKQSDNPMIPLFAKS